MRNTLRRGRLASLLRHLFGATLPVLLFTMLTLSLNLSATATSPRPAPLDPPPPPTPDPDRPTAVVVAGATGAESLDVLAPVGVLATSGHFDVVTAAPRREVLPLFPGSPRLRGAEFLPHYDFAELDRALAGPPDVVVLPFVPRAGEPANAPLLAWLRANVSPDTVLLTICGGSWVAAEAGLLDGRSATTHRNLFTMLEARHPATDWVRGRRWVEDGNVVSSAGITAAVDASLRVVERFAGRGEASATARRLGYRHLHLLDEPGFTVPVASRATWRANSAWRIDRTDVGVVVGDGVGELELAAVVDLYPRTGASTVQLVGDGVVTTRHGLHLVSTTSWDAAAGLDRLVVPGHGSPGAAAEVQALADGAGPPVTHLGHDPTTFAFDAALVDLATHDSRSAAALVATGVEYPLPTPLPGRRWPLEVVMIPALLAAMGAGATMWRRRRAATTREAARWA
ncbi:DJ-1/PfpI family protein [Egicoccus sp. AB-alg2]|uniref:DJ-1/PfpI family protein n=1 Tax=Egicoccus sp. AB-alg2 TaxID=3242693 RepID=UPI00359E74B8